MFMLVIILVAKFALFVGDSTCWNFSFCGRPGSTTEVHVLLRLHRAPVFRLIFFFSVVKKENSCPYLLYLFFHILRPLLHVVCVCSHRRCIPRTHMRIHTF